MGAMGGSFSLGTLWVNIAAKTDEAIKSLQGFGSEFGKELDAQKGKWEGLKQVGESMTTVGAGLTAGLTAPIAGIGAAAVNAASEFESSLNKITAVGGQTGADLEKLRGQAMQLGADTKYSAQEAAEGMGNLAAAGQNTTQIMQSMPGVLDLAAAGQLSVQRAAEVTTDTLGQFGMAADQAGRIANVMAASAAASSIDVQQVADAMRYAGPIAQSAGVSFEETATAISLLGNAGIKGEQAGTSLRGILSSLISPSKAAQEALDALGVTTTDAAGKMLPLDQIFASLKAQGASTADMFTIFGQNAASAAAALTQDAGPAWAAMTGEIAKSDGAAKTMADTLNSGLKGGFEQLKGSLDTVLISLGTSLLPVITNLVKVGTEFLNNWVLPAVEWFGKLDPTVQTVVITLAGLLAALGPVLVIAGSIVSAIATLAPIFAAAGAAIGAFAALLSGPVLAIAAITAALIALGVWVYSNWDTIVASLSGAWDTIAATWESVWGGIVGAVTAIWDTFKTVIAAYFGFYVEMLSAVWNVLTAIWEAEWNLIVGAVTAIWDAIEPYVHAVLDPVVRAVTLLWDGIKALWGAEWAAIKFVVTAVWDALVFAADKVLKPVVKYVDELWDGVKKSWEKIWTGIRDTVLGIWREIEKAVGQFSGALSAIGKAVGGLPGKLNTVADSIRGVGKEADKAAGHSPVPELADALKDVKDRAGALPGPLGLAKQGIEDVGGAADTAAEDVAGLNTDVAAAPGWLTGLSGAAVTLSGTLNQQLAPAVGLADGAIRAVGTAAETTGPKLTTFGSTAGTFSTNTSTAFGTVTTAAGDIARSVLGLETDLPGSMGRTIAGITGKLTNPSTGVPAMSKPFEELASSVGGIVQNFAGDLIHSLWEGDTSWGEKGKALLKSLGGAVENAFVKPAEDAIQNLLKGAISDLLGGKGLGGVMDSITGIGKSLGGLFGGGSDAADVAGKVPVDKVPGVPGAGGAAGAAGGLMGTIGAIGAIGSFITGAIGNIQNISMSTDLGHIEENTRTTAIIVRDQMWGLMHDTLPKLAEYIVYAVEHLHNAYNEIADFKYSFNTARPWIDDIRAYTGRGADTLDRLYNATLSQGTEEAARFERLLGAVLDVSTAIERSMTFNVNGTDPALVGGYVAGRIRLQGGVA
jgi:TP901 family phage tail tape measure protein